MTKPLTFDSRSAIRRAKFFLTKANQCPTSSREDFEAYLEASIIFARTAILRIENKYKKKQVYKSWWSSIKDDSSVKFFKKHRDHIIHRHPPQVGQIMKMPLLQVPVRVSGEPVGNVKADNSDTQAIASRDTTNEYSLASDLYYFTNASVSATKTVEDHLVVLEGYVNAFFQALK